MTFEEEIFSLIDSQVEGGYYDFKAEWHSNKASLLHDIICMANNLENKDAYIIIGVDESDRYNIKSVGGDVNRRSSADLVTFLREKNFIGEIRPSVNLVTLKDRDNVGEFDIIVIKNSRHTPFFLKADFRDQDKCVLKNTIYTRINDTNTPIDAMADIDKIEYLWQKRFGINLTPIEKMEMFLENVDNWEYYDDGDDDERLYYYKQDPMFKIKLERLEDRSDFYNKLFIDPRYYSWFYANLTYYDVTLETLLCCNVDGGRGFVSIPELDSITRVDSPDRYCYYYIVNNSIGDKLQKIYNTQYFSNDNYLSNKLSFIIFFNDEIECGKFNQFLKESCREMIENLSFPEEVLRKNNNLTEEENKQYITAKQIKYIYKNKFKTDNGQ